MMNHSHPNLYLDGEENPLPAEDLDRCSAQGHEPAKGSERPFYPPCTRLVGQERRRQLSWLARVLIGLVYVYRLTLGWLLGGQCRFFPSCSQYFIEAVEKYGTCRGAWKGFKRLWRCHPFHPGGYDPP